MNENSMNKLISIYQDIESDIIDKIVDKLQLGNVNMSTKWLLEQLNREGALTEEVIEILQDRLDMTKEELKTILTDAGYNNLPKVKQLDKFRDSQVVKNLIENSYIENIDSFVRINQDIVKGTREAYTNIINQVYLETTTGVTDYQSSLRKAMNDMSDKGITTATYQSIDSDGVTHIRNYSIEGAIRRELMTATHQLAGKVNQASIEELKPKYVKITEHDNCRDSHLPWQGCYVRTEDFIGITDYGSITGIEGINCRHLHFAYFGEVDENKYKNYKGYKIFTQDKHISDEKAEKIYKLSQKQRYIERTIRKYKRRAEMWKNKDKEEYILARAKIREWQGIMRAFIDKHDELDRQYIRERI